MRVAVGVLAALGCLLECVAPAQATSCLAPPPAVERFQAAEAAVVATVIGTRALGPAAPPREPFIAGAPRGPTVLVTYRVVRVYKAGPRGPVAGDVFHRWGRVHSGGLPQAGGRGAFLLEGGGSDWNGRLGGICSFGLTLTELRQAALVTRYGPGEGVAAQRCSFLSCWSVKRDGREAIFRVATVQPDGNLVPFGVYDYNARYDLCVRAPDRTTTCRRFEMGPDRSGVVSSRVRWSRRFPNLGPGVYRVQWRPPALEYGSEEERRYRKWLPSLSFRR